MSQHKPQPPTGSTPAPDTVPVLTDCDGDGRLRFAVAVGDPAGLVCAPGEEAAYVRNPVRPAVLSRAWALAA